VEVATHILGLHKCGKPIILISIFNVGGFMKIGVGYFRRILDF